MRKTLLMPFLMFSYQQLMIILYLLPKAISKVLFCDFGHFEPFRIVSNHFLWLSSVGVDWERSILIYQHKNISEFCFYSSEQGSKSSKIYFFHPITKNAARFFQLDFLFVKIHTKFKLRLGLAALWPQQIRTILYLWLPILYLGFFQ